MKRQTASRDINTVKRGKFLAKLAVVTASIAHEQVDRNETYEDAIGDGEHLPAQPLIFHSTPIYSTQDQSPSVEFGNATPIDEPEFLGANHLFGIDVHWNEDLDNFEDDGSIEVSSGILDNDNSALLYSKCTNYSSAVSLDEFCCILVAYQRKNQLSDAAMDGFCKLIKRLLPTPNNCPESFGIVQRNVKRLINLQFDGICSDLMWLCTACQSIFETRKQCLDCCKTAGRVRKPATFFECNIEKQIKLVVDVHGREIIKFLTDTAVFCQQSSAVRDLSSGYYYRENALPNPRGDNMTLHLLINADGAKFTKAKTGSFWPIDAQIIELPPKLRVKFENSVLLALWQGDSKPEWNVVMSRIVDELQTLSKIGFPAEINGRIYFVRVRVLATVFDLPAAASIWNTVQFNGKYGCMHCKEPGVLFKKRRIWPYVDSIELKDSNFWKEAYQEIALGSPVPYFGVKGKSIFADLLVNPYLQNPLDFMHQAYEGVFDKILSCLFGTGKPWCFGKGKNLREMDEKVSAIKFPVDFQRRIPSLENLSYFKASEFKNLLLYGIVPMFVIFLFAHNITDPKVIDFLHWIMVYHEVAVRLNSDQVDLESMEFVDRLISIWQQLFPDFIGEEHQTYNAHSTRHIVHFVRALGPLHNYSTFAFENFNNVYAKMVTSAHGTLSQVSRRFMEEKFIKFWHHSSTKCNAGDLVTEILGKPDSSASNGKRYGSVKILSAIETVSPSMDQADALKLAFGDTVSTILSVHCVKVGSTLIRTEHFEHTKTMCTHIAKFCEQEGSFYGIVVRIFIYLDRVFALCKELRVTGKLIDKVAHCTDTRLSSLWENNTNPYGTFFHLVDRSDAFRIVEMKNLAKRCILANFEPYMILMEECMSFEHN